MIKDRRLRTMITSKSHYWFCSFYLAGHIKCATPDFHRALFALTENFALGHLVVPAFRGSGKSTIFSLSYPLWAILGILQYKFVVIVAKTQEQARLYLKNIKDELEANDILKADMGPFREDNIWRDNAIVLTRQDAMIMAVSSEQSIRGIKHGNMRPQLIICDDLEDSHSVRNRENRNKLDDWLKNDLMPAGEVGARLVVTGAILHQDSLIMRLKKEIEEGRLTGIYKSYPILDEKGQSMWPGKYPDRDAIEKLKLEIGNEIAWAQEYMLVPATRESAIIKPEWIKRYREIPDIRDPKNEFRYAITGVDPAISLATAADYTAMVSAFVFGWAEKIRIYILPHPVNEKLEFPQAMEKMKLIADSLIPGKQTRVIIESNGFQQSHVDSLATFGYPVEGIKNYGDGKEERLRIVSHHIQRGFVLFPEKGAELLLEQMMYFNSENHDDLADALAILVSKIMSENKKKPATPEIWILEIPT